jgi:hypothetical protein
VETAERTSVRPQPLWGERVFHTLPTFVPPRTPPSRAPGGHCLVLLQPGSSTVCPGGWHFAPPSFGPLLLLPGPKSGEALALDAELAQGANRVLTRATGIDPTPPETVLAETAD